MPIFFITEVILHFPFQYGFKDRAEDLLQGILYVLGIFKIIVFKNLLSNLFSECRRSFFTFRHGYHP
mgnify:CR=1 FL=1